MADIRSAAGEGPEPQVPGRDQPAQELANLIAQSEAGAKGKGFWRRRRRKTTAEPVTPAPVQADAAEPVTSEPGGAAEPKQSSASGADAKAGAADADVVAKSADGSAGGADKPQGESAVTAATKESSVEGDESAERDSKDAGESPVEDAADGGSSDAGSADATAEAGSANAESKDAAAGSKDATAGVVTADGKDSKAQDKAGDAAAEGEETTAGAKGENANGGDRIAGDDSDEAERPRPTVGVVYEPDESPDGFPLEYGNIIVGLPKVADGSAVELDEARAYAEELAAVQSAGLEPVEEEDVNQAELSDEARAGADEQSEVSEEPAQAEISEEVAAAEAGDPAEVSDVAAPVEADEQAEVSEEAASAGGDESADVSNEGAPAEADEQAKDSDETGPTVGADEQAEVAREADGQADVSDEAAPAKAEQQAEVSEQPTPAGADERAEISGETGSAKADEQAAEQGAVGAVDEPATDGAGDGTAVEGSAAGDESGAEVAEPGADESAEHVDAADAAPEVERPTEGAAKSDAVSAEKAGPAGDGSAEESAEAVVAESTADAGVSDGGQTSGDGGVASAEKVAPVVAKKRGKQKSGGESDGAAAEAAGGESVEDAAAGVEAVGEREQVPGDVAAEESVAVVAGEGAGQAADGDVEGSDAADASGVDGEQVPGEADAASADKPEAAGAEQVPGDGEVASGEELEAAGTEVAAGQDADAESGEAAEDAADAQAVVSGDGVSGDADAASDAGQDADGDADDAAVDAVVAQAVVGGDEVSGAADAASGDESAAGSDADGAAAAAAESAAGGDSGEAAEGDSAGDAAEGDADGEAAEGDSDGDAGEVAVSAEELAERLAAEQAAMALITSLMKLRGALAGSRLPLDVVGADEARQQQKAMLDQLDDYILPRLVQLEAPILAVVGGSTGAGKSTLVNSVIGKVVSEPGVLRPTTRSPVLIHHPADADWFVGDRVLPGMARTTAESPGGMEDPGQLRLVASDTVPRGLAVLDAPDIDSVVEANRDLATQLLAAADLWLFVTTAARYSDAVPWEFLQSASDRSTAVAVVLDRAPAETIDDITGHLAQMLLERGLGDSPLFSIKETVVDGNGMLPAETVASIKDWLVDLAADAEGRAAVVRRTLHGAVTSMVKTTPPFAAAVRAQGDTAIELRTSVEAAYEQAVKDIKNSTQDATLLRGEVLARWQEFVGTGELLKGLQGNSGKLRDKVKKSISTAAAPTRDLNDAIESGLSSLLVEQAEAAAERAEKIWQATPAGRQLLAAAQSEADSEIDLGSMSPQFQANAERAVREWQAGVLDLVRTVGTEKRLAARILDAGVNGLSLSVMIVLFAENAGIPTGAEMSIGVGSAVVGQKLLTAVFGDAAVQTLVSKSREDLDGKVHALMDAEFARYLAVLDQHPVDPEAARQLTEAARAVEDCT